LFRLEIPLAQFALIAAGILAIGLLDDFNLLLDVAKAPDVGSCRASLATIANVFCLG
jgi:hypothetical protein